MCCANVLVLTQLSENILISVKTDINTPKIHVLPATLISIFSPAGSD
jgi:hypothetical protein